MSVPSPEITTSWRAPLDPSMMVTVFCSPAAGCCLDADFASGSVEGEAAVVDFSAAGATWRIAIRAIGSPPSGLSLKMAKPMKVSEEQAEQQRERLKSGKRQPEPALASRDRLLSERRAQIVGHFRHGPFPNQPGRRYHGRASPRQIRGKDAASRVEAGGSRRHAKKAARGPPFAQNDPKDLDQFAALAGLSVAVLSAVAGAGAAVAVALMPWSRSSAIFKALSSLASGGT